MNMIRSTASFAVFCGIALCASVGLAGSAFAEPVDGQYTATMLGGNNDKEVGGTVTWGLSGCGPDCVTLQTSGPGVQMTRQGDVWKGAGSDGCAWTMMNDSLYLNAQCPDGSTYVIGMAKI